MSNDKKKYYNGELIVEKARINWIVLLVFAVLGVVLVEVLLQVLLIKIGDILSKIAWYVRIAVWVITLISVARVLVKKLYITEKRVLYRSGLLGVYVKDFPIEHVDNISYRVSLLGRLFFYGTIIITGSSGDDIVFKRVRNVKKFKNAIFEAIERNKQNISSEETIEEQ